MFELIIGILLLALALTIVDKILDIIFKKIDEYIERKEREKNDK